MHLKLVGAIIAFAAMAVGSHTASAVTMGIPVTTLGGSTVVTDFAPANGKIDFYIPLSSSQTYGVSNGGTGGLVPDTCSGSGCGGTLYMFVKFSPVTPGSNILTLLFDDLDLFGVNDPNTFFESIEIFANSVSLALIDEFTDPQVVQAQTNSTNQKLQLSVNVPGDPFWAKLKFKSYFSPQTYLSWQNTPEALIATIAPVPLPAGVWLFALGLGGLGFLKRRQRIAR